MLRRSRVRSDFSLNNNNMYACMHVRMYVKYTFVCIPHQDIYYTLSGMVRSIDTIFQVNGRTADPLDVHTATTAGTFNMHTSHQ